jgi:hypothetical protein
VTLEWSFNPWHDRPLATAIGAALALAICGVVASLGEPLLVRLALCGAVIAALSPAFAPARCRVDETGVEKRGPMGTLRRPWTTLRRAAPKSAGLLVSPYAVPSWLDPYRGLLLPLPVNGRDALLAQLTPILRSHGL